MITWKDKNKEYCVGKILNLKTVIKDMYLNCEEKELVMLQVTPEQLQEESASET